MYPRRKDRFMAWSKAMVEGATVDKPVYPGTKKSATISVTKKRRRRRRRKKKKELTNG